MKKLIIIGARGYGRIVYNIAVDSIEHGADFQIKGFLDGKSDALDGLDGYPPILSSVEDYEIQPNDVFICALGESKYKKEYAEKILAKGGEFISIISPKAYMQTNVKLGKGCVIGYMSSIGCDTTIGDFVTVLSYANIGHDVTIGDWSHVGADTFMGGFSSLGENVMLQTGAKIIPHKKVGDYAYVGIGSIVMKSVKSGTTVLGYPAKVIDI